MQQLSEFLIAVFDYRLTTELVEIESVVDDLVAAGVPADDVRLYVPPFGLHNIGGLQSTLTDLGVDEATARWGEEQYRDGKVLLVVRPGARRQQVEEVLERQGAWEIHPSSA